MGDVVTMPEPEHKLWDRAREEYRTLEARRGELIDAALALGRTLLELRRRHRANGDFGAAVFAAGIDLTSQHQAAFLWLASLEPDVLASLRERFPAAMHPKTLQDRAREHFGPDYGLTKLFSPEGRTDPSNNICEETPEIAPVETVSETVATDDARDMIPVQNEHAPYRAATKIPRIVEVVGERHGAVLFGRYRSGSTTRMLCALSSGTIGIAAVRALAEEIASGRWGNGRGPHALKRVTARLLTDDLPTPFARRFDAAPTVAALKRLVSDAPRIAALLDAMRAARPNDPNAFCHEWWSAATDPSRTASRESAADAPQLPQPPKPRPEPRAEIGDGEAECTYAGVVMWPPSLADLAAHGPQAFADVAPMMWLTDEYVRDMDSMGRSRNEIARRLRSIAKQLDRVADPRGAARALRRLADAVGNAPRGPIERTLPIRPTGGEG